MKQKYQFINVWIVAETACWNCESVNSELREVARESIRFETDEETLNETIYYVSVICSWTYTFVVGQGPEYQKICLMSGVRLSWNALQLYSAGPKPHNQKLITK